MRITFVLPTVGLSGGIRVCAIHAKALAERGHKVVLVSPPPRISMREKLRRLLRFSSWHPGPARSHLDGLGLDHRILETWRPVADADLPDADVVVATWWETAEWVATLSPAKGAKAYFVQHHEVFSNLPVERVRATYRLPLHKIVIARWLQDLMASEYGDTDCDLVPNAVDHRQFFAPPRGKQDRPTVGFLHHQAEFKGVDVALAAIERLRFTFPEMRVVSFGESAEGMLDLGLRIEFAHSPPQERLRDIYARCDVWITASRSEGFNLPAMEAMACRTPVVATRTGWPEEAVDTGRNGVLVDIDDVDGIVEGVEWLLKQPDERWREISLAAFETVEGCSWERSSDLFEAALGNACRKGEESLAVPYPGGGVTAPLSCPPEARVYILLVPPKGTQPKKKATPVPVVGFADSPTPLAGPGGRLNSSSAQTTPADFPRPRCAAQRSPCR